MRRSNSIIVWLVIFTVLAVVAHVMQSPPRVPGEPVTGRARVIDGKGKSYACGHAAQRALIATIAGRSVTCTPVEVDRYNRDVATCLADDLDLGEAMVRGGHALDYPRHSRGRYAAAELEARDARRGMWAGTFERPATWRQQNAKR